MKSRCHAPVEKKIHENQRKEMYGILKSIKKIILMLMFVRNQHFIQNNELFGKILTWGKKGKGKLGIDFH